MSEVKKHVAPKSAADPKPTPVEKTIQLILRRATKAGASHVHLEPRSGYGVVRLRVDGVLQVSTKLPALALRQIVRYLKKEAGLEIGQHQLPQHGHYTTTIGRQYYELELGTLPLLDGEYASIHFVETAAKPAR